MKKQTSNIQNKPTRYIKIPLETWRKLDNLKLENETWDDLLNRLCHYAKIRKIREVVITANAAIACEGK